MSQPTDEEERKHLREQARTAETAEEHRAAFRRLAELDRERNAHTYDALARE